MAKFRNMTPNREILFAQKTWMAGQFVDKGRYVCRHCNSEITLGQQSCLPLCHACYGRRYGLIHSSEQP